MDDWRYDDRSCPECSHHPTRYHDCWKAGCLDGFHDLHEEDPIWYPRGTIERCRECWGMSIVAWCPECGCDLSRHAYLQERNTAEAHE